MSTFIDNGMEENINESFERRNLHGIYLFEINYYESEIMFYTVGVSVIILRL